MKPFNAKQLQEFDLFRHFDKEILNKIAEACVIKTYQKNDIIFSEGSESDSMFLIIEGEIFITKLDVPLAILKEREYFGEMSLWEEKTRTASAKALTKTIMAEFPVSFFNEYVKTSPTAMFDLVLTYDKRLRHHNDLVVKQYQELKSQYIELNESHKRLIQTEKLASVGLITSSIAHEINNPLTILKTYTEILTKKLEKGVESKKYYQDTFSKFTLACNSIEKITTGLKNYVRVGDPDNSPIDLNEAIKGSIDLVSYLYQREQIKINLSLSNDETKIKGNIGKIQQVIINLLSNAKDAMLEKEKKNISINTELDGDYAILTVSDSGSGIPNEKLSTIFEKFYTTKPIGKGTGLGLDIVKKILSNMGATIQVHSKENVGTTFTVKFKLC